MVLYTLLHFLTTQHKQTQIPFSKFCNLIQMASTTKQMKHNYSLKVHKQTSQQYKRQNLINPTKHQRFLTLHLSEQIATQGGGLLIYIKNNISFSQFNTMPKF